MKKIIFLDQFSTLGGGQTVLLQLMSLFSRKSWKVVGAFPGGGELERRAQELTAVEIRPLPELDIRQGKKSAADVLTLLAYLKNLISLVPEIKTADLIYVNGPRLFPLMGFLSMFVPGRYVYHIHLDHTKAQKALIEKLLQSRYTKLIIANSDFTRLQLNRHSRKFEQDKRVVTIPNGLPHHYSDLPFRRPTHTGEKLKFITVGRISPEKGQGFIVDLARRFPHHSFYIVGAPDFSDFKFQKHLQERAPGNVLFVGKTVDVPSLLKEQSISAAIVPSQVAESFGLVAVEAMAASCATIVSDKGELFNISKKTDALVFKDLGELEKQVNHLIKLSVEEFTELAQKQYTKVHQTYSAETFESAIFSAVSKIAEGPK